MFLSERLFRQIHPLKNNMEFVIEYSKTEIWEKKCLAKTHKKNSLEKQLWTSISLELALD